MNILQGLLSKCPRYFFWNFSKFSFWNYSRDSFFSDFLLIFFLKTIHELPWILSEIPPNSPGGFLRMSFTGRNFWIKDFPRIFSSISYWCLCKLFQELLLKIVQIFLHEFIRGFFQKFLWGLHLVFDWKVPKECLQKFLQGHMDICMVPFSDSSSNSSRSSFTDSLRVLPDIPLCIFSAISLLFPPRVAFGILLLWFFQELIQKFLQKYILGISTVFFEDFFSGMFIDVYLFVHRKNPPGFLLRKTFVISLGYL